MKDKNREFEETGAFLDLMSKKERKRWKDEQSRIKGTNNTEQNSSESAPQPTNENELENQTNQQVQEIVNDEEKIEQTKSIQINNDNDSNEYIEEKTFNPVVPLGIALMGMIIFFIYLMFFTDFNHNTFLIVNSIIIIFFTFCFGITTLCNKKHVKVFAIFDLLIILGFIIFNGISITNYENIYNKVETEPVQKEENPKEEIKIDNKEEEKIINEYSCINEEKTISVSIKEENGYILYLKKEEILKNNSLALANETFYKDIEHITTNVEDKTLTIEFDFNNLDINKYKESIQKYNDNYRLDSDFSYIENDKVNYEKYTTLELNDLTCTKLEN